MLPLGILFIEEESNYNEMNETLFHDIVNLDDTKVVVEPHRNTSFFMNYFPCMKALKFFPHITSSIIKKHYNLPKHIKKFSKKYDKTVLLFLNSSLNSSRCPYEVLDGLKKKYKNTFWVLYYYDSIDDVHSEYANELREKGLFDAIYSFDKIDSEKYGIKYWPTPYSKIYSSCDEIDSDCYFCGWTKGNRKDLLKKIYNLSKENNVNLKADFITGTDGGYDGITTWEDAIDYKYLLEKIVKTNCIIDIVSNQKQVGLTLRPYEAICYNKKLISNHSRLKDFEYYDSRYMKYFENVEDIDWDWVKKVEEVKYNYHGEKSPLKLLDDIKIKMNEAL